MQGPGRGKFAYSDGMRRSSHRLLVASLLAALGVAACGGWSPVPDASGAPGTGVPPTPVGGQPAAAGVIITALNIEFNPQAVSVPAGQPFTIQLLNRDQDVPHNIQVSDANGNVLVKSEIIRGPATLTIGVPALAAGTYPFTCIVHPNMTGTITAE